MTGIEDAEFRVGSGFNIDGFASIFLSLALTMRLMDVYVHMQHGIKDMEYSTGVKDEEGYPTMALVNRATAEALKHSLG